MKKCPVCNHPKREKIEQLVLDNISRRVIAAQYGFSLTDLNTHIEYHMQPDLSNVKPQEIANKPTIEVLTENLNKIAQRLQVLLDNTSPDDYSANKQIKMLMSEVRNAAVNIAQLKGQLVQEQHITIVQYNTLRSIILSELCPECRAKVIERLKQEEENAERETVR